VEAMSVELPQNIALDALAIYQAGVLTILMHFL
jgi:hypothetical protein